MKGFDVDRKAKVSAAAGILVILVAGYMYSPGSSTADSLSVFLDSHGYEFESNTSYSVEDISRSTVAGIPVAEIESASGESRVSASVYSGVDSAFASSYMQDRREELASIYTDTPAPYEGVPGREVDCPDRFVPELGENSTSGGSAEFSLYSDAERKIGACSNSTAEYHTQISMLYCPSRDSLISLKISRPLEEGKISTDITCR